MNKSVRLIAPALMIAATSLATIPQMAQAGSSLCGASRVCIYDDLNWVGLLGERPAGQGSINVGSGSNDKMSSWENKTSSNGRWHTDANSSGTCRTLSSFNQASYVGDSGNDKLTSWATNGGC